MESYLVSCVVPVYNGERYIREALDSILAQTHRPLEVLVADDGSTDGTSQVLEEYGDRICTLTQPNAGPAAACNLGLYHARGSFVAFLAADDLWHPEKLERQLTRFKARPELDLCVTHIQNFWEEELAEEAERLGDHRIAQPMPGYTSVTLLARQSVFEATGPFDETLQHGIDLDWFMRAADKGAVIELLPDVLVSRRLHSANRSRALASNSRDTFLRLLKTSLDRRRTPQSAPSTYEFPGSDDSRPPESSGQ